MALKQPAPVSFFRAIYLCAIAIVAPSKFEKLDSADRASLESRPNDTRKPADHLRQALFRSLFLVLLSGLVGLILSELTCRLFGPSKSWLAALQVLGAMILLWATLAVRGWDVLTFSGVTLTERVNQWIYRTLYCLGTALLVMTVGWSYCN